MKGGEWAPTKWAEQKMKPRILEGVGRKKQSVWVVGWMSEKQQWATKNESEERDSKKEKWARISSEQQWATEWAATVRKEMKESEQKDNFSVVSVWIFLHGDSFSVTI